MKGNQHTQPFNDLLMTLVINENELGTTGGNLEKEAEIVFSRAAIASLSSEKTELLIAKLTNSLTKETLGALVKDAMNTSVTPLPDLHQATGLTPSLLENIKNDMVFTNSVPVKSLLKLIKILNISLAKATAGIAATFEKLQTESRIFSSMPTKIQPAFKKGISQHAQQSDFRHLKQDESYLYQNKEALDKYTQRLSELYQQA
ncbi:hypothetical protein [Paraflavitalea sp. CAU 1676]|uniref:hypothetical protein n=1 Tax=Paraflavitalea sp. CAU 1676 TaxID=3032598 RepID=UPI0023DC7B0B|nr:hypothetical protein [Paraflavitalea sp. CAU 1676]MDF2188327.1 hypothetical protein [Paraflavitalea sp. CAU 1676]